VRAREGQLRSEFKIKLKSELEHLTAVLQSDHKDELAKVGRLLPVSEECGRGP
jgi:hypothetical protein